jgi:hypothetical protein
VVLSFFGSYIESTTVAPDQLRTGSGPQTVTITSAEFSAGGKAELFYLGLEKAVSTLEQAGKEVVIIADVPELRFFPRDCLARTLAAGNRPDCSPSAEQAAARRAAHVAQLARLSEHHRRLRVFDPFDLICPGATCEIDRAGVLMYRDSHHLSLRGSELVGRKFANWLNPSPTSAGGPDAGRLGR